MKGDSKPDWEILTLVRNALDKESEHFAGLGEVIKNMSEQFSSYSEISLFKIGSQGMALNGKNT
jgi:hypothetical protein